MKFSKYRFIIKPEKELILPPYKGSTIRGGFGHVLRSALCVERQTECADCVNKNGCIYSYIFETSVTLIGENGGRNEEIPHPFIIEPPLDKRQHYGINNRLEFDLIIIGRAVDYYPYLIFAFEELGRRGLGKNNGKYSLDKVISFNNNQKFLIYDGESHVKDEFHVIDSVDLFREAEKLDYKKITFHFLTPTRIKYNGKYVSDINFEIIIRNLLRRLSSLSESHCDEKWVLDWKDLINNAKENVRTVSSNLKWHDWERYSSRQDSRIKMGGFMGEITFEGDFLEFMPFIILGEYLHMGKGTVYGLGKYEIISG